MRPIVLHPTALTRKGGMLFLIHLDSNPTEDSSCLSLCQAILADFKISNFYFTLQLGRKKQVKPQWLYGIPPFGP